MGSEMCIRDRITVSPVDLLKYKSLRTISFAVAAIVFSKRYVKFGPLILIDNLGVNIFVNQIVMALAECIGTPLSLNYVQKLPRKMVGYVSFSVSIAFFAIVYLVQPPSDCNFCVEGILELSLIFILRIVTTFYYPFMSLTVTELFPLRVRSMGFGISGAFGATAASTSQFLLLSLRHTVVDPFLFLIGICLLGVLGVCMVPETVGKPLKD